MGLLAKVIEKIQPEKEKPEETPAAAPAPVPASSVSNVPEASASTTMSAQSLSSLKPAFVVKGKLGNISPMGVIHTGANYTHFEFSAGTIESEPGFEPAFKADVQFGADWFQIDADGQRGRTNIRAISKTGDGAFLEMRSKGVLELAGPMSKIFTMAPDMATTPFGLITGTVSIVTGDPKLKSLEHSIFVTNTRFTVDETGIAADMRVSQVIGAAE